MDSLGGHLFRIGQVVLGLPFLAGGGGPGTPKGAMDPFR